jgi:uncharacterized protein (DUF486 family)
MIKSILLLSISNVFMTYAWYGHLKDLRAKPLWIAIVASWSIALLEYCFQVPANRMGSQVMTLGQLKVTQEVITMVIFAVFAVVYMGAPLGKNYLWAALCLVGAAYFIFKDGLGAS